MLEASKDFDQIKIIDFGTALKISKGKTLQAVYGTKQYVAPEVLNHNYGKKCDVWSIGVIAYLLLSGHHPFHTTQQTEIQL